MFRQFFGSPAPGEPQRLGLLEKENNMITNSDKTTIAALLGAGASVDASIPTAVKMTQEIYNLTGDYRTGNLQECKALGYIIAGVLFQKSIEGHSPYSEPDIEEIFTAIDQLANREKLEILPFISSWHPAINLLEADATDTFRIRSDFKKSLDSLLNNPRRRNDDMVKLFRIIQRLGSNEPKSEIFKRLIDIVMGKLKTITWIEDSSVVDYLKPLVLLPNLKFISTLNYDNAIELAAFSAKIKYSVGVEHWSELSHVSFDPDRLKLLKLHGSINWAAMPITYGRKHEGKPAHTKLVIKTDRVGEHYYYTPFIVFGKGDKLTSVGPFLELYNEFTASLEHVEHLLIVGYSFRDIHINTAVKKWFDTNKDRTVQIIGSKRVRECKEKLFQYFLRHEKSSGRVRISSDGAAKGLTRLAEGEP